MASTTTTKATAEGLRWAVRKLVAPDLPPSLHATVDELAGSLAPLLRPTPLEWHEALGCYLKREDLGVVPTHKSRGVGLQVAIAQSLGARGAVISSSGNAAVAAGAWMRALGLPGVAFLSDRTDDAKVEAVAATGVPTAVTPKPKNFSRYAARYAGLVDLRPSNDPNGRLGYRTLAVELVEQLGAPPTSVILFINSGLTLVGLQEGFERLLQQGRVPFVPRLQAVQCTGDTALAEALGMEAVLEEVPCVGSLGAQSPTDLPAAASAIARTMGRLWMVTNDEVDAERLKMASHQLTMAGESMAMMAGLRKARRLLGPGMLGERVVAIVAGPERRRSETTDQRLASVHRLESYADVRELLESLGLGRADEP